MQKIILTQTNETNEIAWNLQIDIDTIDKYT